MASRDATIMKREAAMARLKAALPGIEFDPQAFRGGPEYQHAADLETIAAYLESGGAARVPATTSTTAKTGATR